MAACTLQIRLPGGQRLRHQLSSESTLLDVAAFVSSSSDLQLGTFSLLTTFPKKEYLPSVFKSTLLSSIPEVNPRGVFVVQETSMKGVVMEGHGPVLTAGQVLHPHSEGEFDSLVRGISGKLVVVDYFAVWCPPCQKLSPMIVQVAKNLATRVVFVKVDVDECRSLASREGISAMPTMHAWRNGQRIGGFEIKGLDPAFEEKIVALLE